MLRMIRNIEMDTSSRPFHRRDHLRQLDSSLDILCVRNIKVDKRLSTSSWYTSLLLMLTAFIHVDSTVFD